MIDKTTAAKTPSDAASSPFPAQTLLLDNTWLVSGVSLLGDAVPLCEAREEVMVLAVCGTGDAVIVEETGLGIGRVEITTDSEKDVKVIVSWKMVTG